MNAETPSLQPAIDAVRGLATTAVALSAKETETVREVVRRLERLSIQVAELVRINNQLLAATGMKVDFDSTTDTLVVKLGDLEERFTLRRADPNVPLSMNVLGAGQAYTAGVDDQVSPKDAAVRLDLESGLEAFYQSAHRVLKLLGTIPGLSKIRSPAITQVRNKLIEHADHGMIYSFGYGSTGPQVKPLRRGASAWNDGGLVPNTREFVDAIVNGIAAKRT